MKRRSSLTIDDGPAQKHLADSIQIDPNKWNQFCRLVKTSGKVVWSGTVESADSQKIMFDCSIKVLSQYDEGIKSWFPQKQLTIHSISVSVYRSLLPYKVQSGVSILCMDENTDMKSHIAFSQAIRLGSATVCCTVLKNNASALHLLFAYSFSYGHEDYIIGVIVTFQANDTVLGILRSHGLPCVDLEHEELVKQITTLKEELQYKDKKLTEQQWLNQKLVKRHKKKMAEKERKHEEERNMMEEQMRDKERTIITLDRKIKDVQHGKEEIVIRMFSEFQCCICRETLKQASTLPVCGHMFCYSCISKYLKMKAKCPLCRSCAGSPIQCIGIDRLISNLTDHMGNEAQQQRIKALKDHAENVHALPIEEGGSSQEEVVVPEGVRVRELDVSSEAVDGERLPGEQANARLDSFLATLPMEIQLSPPSSISSQEY